MGDAEDRGVHADAERERKYRDEDEARVSAHAAEGETDVLKELRGVLARTDRQHRARGCDPDTQQAQRPAPRGIAALVAEHLLHVASVVRAEIVRQDPQEAAEPPDIF